MIAFVMSQVRKINAKRAMQGYALAAILVLQAQGLLGQSLYPRAPDVIPGTLKEMRTVEFWLARMERPDEVIRNLAEIREMNEAYQQKMGDIPRFVSGLDEDLAEQFITQFVRSPGLEAVMPKIGAQAPSEISATVKDLVRRQIQHVEGRQYGNRLAVEYSSAQIEDLVGEFAESALPAEIKPASGIVVQNSLLKIVPTIHPEHTGLSQAGKSRWDLWNLDVVKIGSPIRILHKSKSGGHLLVLSERGYGWIESKDVALTTAAKAKSFSEAQNFIVVIGDRVPFYASHEATYVSGWLRMGDRLPLVETDDNGQRQVMVPVRKTNGEFVTEVAWLAPDADVHSGYLPYTRKNVVTQSFKLLDNVYDWTGGWFGRNHATSLRDIFSTFGFELPANGVFIAQFNGGIKLLPKEQSKEDRYKTIFTSEPFLTFITSASGHSELYLGNHHGQVITFDTHGYGYENESGEILEIRRWGVSTLELPAYMLKQDILLTQMR